MKPGDPGGLLRHEHQEREHQTMFMAPRIWQPRRHTDGTRLLCDMCRKPHRTVYSDDRFSGFLCDKCFHVLEEAWYSVR